MNLIDIALADLQKHQKRLKALKYSPRKKKSTVSKKVMKKESVKKIATYEQLNLSYEEDAEKNLQNFRRENAKFFGP